MHKYLPPVKPLWLYFSTSHLTSSPFSEIQILILERFIHSREKHFISAHDSETAGKRGLTIWMKKAQKNRPLVSKNINLEIGI